MHKIQLIEPEWGLKILEKGIEIQNAYPWVENFAPIGADVFVIIYPIFLVGLYVYGIVKKKLEEKQGALYIFFSTFFSVLVNIGIQCLFLKERPVVALKNYSGTEETLLHEILPASSFPSDHSVVGMSFAVATLVWGIYSKKKWMKRSGIILIFVSFVMSSCRILTLVHWPSDILAGYLIGICIPLLLFIPGVRKYLFKWIINPIIKLEQRLLKKLFHYEQ